MLKYVICLRIHIMKLSRVKDSLAKKVTIGFEANMFAELIKYNVFVIFNKCHINFWNSKCDG